MKRFNKYKYQKINIKKIFIRLLRGRFDFCIAHKETRRREAPGFL